MDSDDEIYEWNEWKNLWNNFKQAFLRSWEQMDASVLMIILMRRLWDMKFGHFWIKNFLDA